MTAASPSPAGRTFVDVVRELGFLAPDKLAGLTADAAAQDTSPAQLALTWGLLDVTQLDIIDTLLHSTDTVPGYELLGLLGRGGMGVVYKARQLALDRSVAIKTILVGRVTDASALGRFEQEARSVAKLAHPHIITAYDYGRREGRVWFVMELVEGIDAQAFIRRHGRLDEWTTWGLVRQAAAGLAHASEQGFVHRDIKPANLLLVRPPAGYPLPAGLPMVKIADFGLARLTEVAEGDARLTETNLTVGTPHYMAPEQLQGEDVGPHSDIFSLGATAFCMLTGRPPLDGQSLPQIVARRLQGPVDSLREARPDASPASVALVEAMMHPDPRQRLGDYHDLLARIDRLGIASPAEIATRAVVIAQSAAAAETTDLPAANAQTPPTALPSATPAAPARSTEQRRRSSLASGFQVAALGCLAAAMLAWALLGGRTTVVPRDLHGSGHREPLFDGRDIAPWRTLVGGWATAHDDEGAIVLEGRGEVARGLGVSDGSGGRRTPAHYRITCVVDRHESSGVELRFDLPAATGPRSEAGALLAVRIDAAGATLGAHRAGAPLRILASRPTAASLHAIEIERQARGWWIIIDGEVLATARFLHQPPAPEIRFVSEDGAAWISDVEIEELAVPPDVKPQRAANAAMLHPRRQPPRLIEP